MANSVDPEQEQTDLGLVYTICICHFSELLVYEILGHLPQSNGHPNFWRHVVRSQVNLCNNAPDRALLFSFRISLI